MAQTLYPNSLISNNGFSSGTVGDVASADGTTTDAGGNSDYIQYGFATPSGNALVTGAASQSFTILAAKTSGSGTNDATLEVALYDNGTLVSTLGTAVLTSTTNATHSFNWDGADVTAGADVEIRVTQTDGGGGSPSKRSYVALDEIYWTADSFTEITAGEPISLAGQDNGLVDGTSFATHDAETSDDFTTVTGSPARSTTVSHGGTYSYHLSGDSVTRNNLEFRETSWGTTSWMVVEYWFQYTGGLPSTTQQAYVEDTTGSGKVDIRYIAAELILRDAGGTDTATASASGVSAGNWYRVKFAWENNAGADSRARIELYNSSGTLLSSGSGTGDFSDGLGADNWLGFVGPGSDALELYIDDVEVFEDSDYVAPGPTFYGATVGAGSGDVDRAVNASTESATATSQSATVTADVDRDVSGSVNSATATANASTVDTSSDLNLTASVNSATATVNGALVDTSLDRDVSASANSATATANDATVDLNVDLDVSATRNTATATVNTSTVDLGVDLDVSATLASATATTQSATVSADTDRSVSASTEAANASTQAATVTADVDRDVSASTEAATASTQTANVVREEDLDVSASTASATATSQAATIDTSSDRSVSGSVNVATATTNQSTVQADADRDVTAGLAQATATVPSSTVETGADRDVSASVSSATATSYAATVETSSDRTVSATVSSATASGGQATVTRDRTISATRSSITATASPATVDTSSDRVVTATLSVAQSATSQAGISADRLIASQAASAGTSSLEATIDASLELNALTAALRASTGASDVGLGKFSDAPPSRSFTSTATTSFSVGSGIGVFTVPAPPERSVTSSTTFTADSKDSFNV